MSHSQNEAARSIPGHEAEIQRLCVVIARLRYKKEKKEKELDYINTQLENAEAKLTNEKTNLVDAEKTLNCNLYRSNAVSDSDDESNGKSNGDYNSDYNDGNNASDDDNPSDDNFDFIEDTYSRSYSISNNRCTCACTCSMNRNDIHIHNTTRH